MAAEMSAQQPRAESLRIGILVFQDVTQLDFTAPLEVFHRIPGAKVALVSNTQREKPVISEKGCLRLLPDFDLGDAPQFDLVLVPGGYGVNALMRDAAVLDFLRRQAAKARYVTSVCTGALVLAAAGLLDGYRATTHWAALDVLRMFPKVEVLTDRVVMDGQRITAGGITAGVDFGLSVAAKLVGENRAKEIALIMEYDPAPPFAGRPDAADQHAVEAIVTKLAPAVKVRKELASQAIEELKLGRQ